MIQRIQQWLEPPVFAGDPAKTAQVRSLNTLFVNLGITLIVTNILLVPLLVEQKIGTFVITTVLFIGVLIGRSLIFKGQFSMAGKLIVGLAWLCFLIMTLFSSGSTSPAMFYLGSVTLIAGFILNVRLANGLTVLTVLMVLGFLLFKSQGFALPNLFDFTPLTSLIAFGLGLAFMNSVRNIFLGNLKQALAYAQEENTARRHTEQSLRESEQSSQSTALRLAVLVENMQFGILFEDSTRHVALANQAFCNLMSIPFPASALVGADCREAAQSSKQLMADPEGFVQRITAILDQKRPVANEELLLADGRIFERDYIPISIDNQPAGHLWQYRDITERKRVDESLRLSEEKFSTAFRISPDSININRLRDGMNIEINQGFTALTGFTEEDVLGKTSAELNLWVVPQDRDHLVKELREHGEVHNLETQFRIKNGQILTCLISARIVELNQEKCILTITRDITTQKATQQKLLEQTHRIQVISEISLRMAESVNDFKKIADLCVRRCAELIGDGASLFWYSPDRPYLELISVYNPNPDLVSFFIDHMQKYPIGANEGSYGRVIQTNQAVINPMVDMERIKAAASPERLEYYQKLPVYSAIFAPLRSEGRCLGVIGMGRHDPNRPPYTHDDLVFLQEIADRISFGLVNARLYEELQKELSVRITAENEVRRLNNELEQRVRQRTAELEVVNHELESFSYSVSHDLRAPLRALDGYSGILISEYQDHVDEQGQHYLARIQESTRRMGQLIEDLLNLSRINRRELNYDQVDLSALAWQIANRLQVEMTGRQVQFDIALDLKVFGDPGLIKIALENLMNNAFKFTGKQKTAHIRVGMREQNGECIYFVQDNGAGFEMAYAEKLFTPFQRLHGASEYPGTGIGLSIVQRIIARHGGRIWPEAEVDHGATFYFTLGNHSLAE